MFYWVHVLTQAAFTCSKATTKHQNNVWNLFNVLKLKTDYSVFNLNLQQISHIVLVFPLFTLNK